MPLATIDIPPGTEHVRTARMIVVTAARRSGLTDEIVEDVRLAVGEAVARAVLRHEAAGRTDSVRVVVRQDQGSFEVDVVDMTGVVDTPDVESQDDRDLAMGLIRSIAPEVDQISDQGSSTLTLRWGVSEAS